MRTFSKPKVIVSKCLGFAYCRYNGQTIDDMFVNQLGSYVEFSPVCPEVEIGLGVPRDPIRIILNRGKLSLTQPATGRDLTQEMNRFAESFFSSVTEVDGFILKARSPSCGIKDVKVYPSVMKQSALAKSAGFFGQAVIDRFTLLPIDDEGRLTNFKLREHFLTKLYSLASFRAVKKSMKELVEFHTENKFLFMANSQKTLRELGRIVANHEKNPIEKVWHEYSQTLLTVFAKIPRCTSVVNVLLHALGYFSKNLTAKEKNFFLDTLEKYRLEKVSLSVPLNILNAWIVRFNEPFLSKQTFFSPYPEGLMQITDSGKGRDL